jgi:chemotaxis protein methyltransferase CheR
MRDDCTAFLQWALPRLGMRWPGFRRVRSQVCKRIGRRIRELELDGFAGYREYLESHDGEWRRLDGLCRITISRFWRDRSVFGAILDNVLPTLAAEAADRGAATLRSFSCGCASGEEPYSLAIGWRLGLGSRYPGLDLSVVAADADPQMLKRAKRAVYPEGSLRDLPSRWRAHAFSACEDGLRLGDEFRRDVTFLCQDVREQVSEGPFDLVLCRNLVFTYYREPLQVEIAGRLAQVLRPGGALVVGSHESLPKGASWFEPWGLHRAIYRRIGALTATGVGPDY